MKRSEVWWVNFEPAVGGEIKKTRPAVIVSNDAANEHMNRVQVIPLTSNVSRFYPCECAVTIDGRTSKAMADQIMTVSKKRLYERLGAVSAEDMEAVERIIRVQLGLGA